MIPWNESWTLNAGPDQLLPTEWLGCWSFAEALNSTHLQHASWSLCCSKDMFLPDWKRSIVNLWKRVWVVLHASSLHFGQSITFSLLSYSCIFCLSSTSALFLHYPALCREKLIVWTTSKGFNTHWIPAGITKEEGPGDLRGGGKWGQGIYALILSQWGHLGFLRLLNWPKWLTLVLLPGPGSHSLPSFWAYRWQQPRFLHHPLLFPQYFTYIFVTNPFINKPSSVFLIWGCLLLRIGIPPDILPYIENSGPPREMI